MGLGTNKETDMGDIADAMLDGTLCSGCGEYLGDDSGFPQACFSCRSEEKKRKKAEALDRAKRIVADPGTLDRERRSR